MANGPIALAVQPEAERRRQKCIALLELLLEEAKTGAGFETVFFIGTLSDRNDMRQGWTEGLSTMDIVARLAVLQHDLLAEMRDGERRV